MTEVLRFRGLGLTLNQCKAHAKTIRLRAIPGVPLKGDDRWFMAEMLRLIPRDKLAPHPQSITVQAQGGFRVFCAHYADGTTEFFGLTSIGQSANRVAAQRFSKACRHEVFEQTADVKRQAYSGGAKVMCAITGRPLDRGKATVDHWPVGFRSILDAWLAANNLNWRDIELTKIGVMIYFTDRALGRSWREYHRTHAQYRIAHAKANRAQGNPQHAKT